MVRRIIVSEGAEGRGSLTARDRYPYKGLRISESSAKLMKRVSHDAIHGISTVGDNKDPVAERRSTA